MRTLASLLAVLTGFAAALPAGADGEAKKFMVYVGTYTRGTPSQGIYRMEFDPATGKLSAPVVAARTTNPSFLALHPTGKYLYAVGEIADFGKKSVGAVSAFAVDDKGDLKLLNQQSSMGAGPCHVTVDKAGRYAFAANYGGGSACALPIAADGKLGKATAVVQHKGKSVDRRRQEAPHAHSINLDAANRFAFVADLGLDKVMVYRFDKDKGTLTPNDPPAGVVKPGGGPRHFAFHPNGKFAYTNNEMTSSVTAFRYDADKGTLEEIQTISTLPAPVKGNSTAEIVVHPSGRFLYCSNRGHNSIAIFAVDAETGRLTARGHQGKGIRVPRNFAIDPTGRYCLVANQDGNDVLVFRIVPKTGHLGPTEYRVEIPRPVCIRFLAWR